MAEVTTKTGDELVEIKTENGEILLQLFPEKAPNHVENFKRLISEEYYDGMYFHRVIQGFMAQGGDPTLIGKPSPDFSLKAEFNDTPFERGVLGMARTQVRDSASTQFFIMFDQASHLNGDYTAFGKVVQGMDVVDDIKQSDKMITVRMVPAN